MIPARFIFAPIIITSRIEPGFFYITGWALAFRKRDFLLENNSLERGIENVIDIGLIFSFFSTSFIPFSFSFFVFLYRIVFFPSVNSCSIHVQSIFYV